MTFPAWPEGSRARYDGRMMLLPALALACLAGRAAAQPQPLAPGATAPAVSTAAASEAATLTQNSKTLLDVRDSKSALDDADAAVRAGGGADAYAARAEAKLAVSRPDDALIDYAEAARRAPARYEAKNRALQARIEPNASLDKPRKNAAARGVAGISIVVLLGLAGAGVALVVFGLLYLRRKKTVGKSAAEL